MSNDIKGHHMSQTYRVNSEIVKGRVDITSANEKGASGGLASYKSLP